eukprot:jgi/Bigna1/80517/fgenesh1_pg.71_\
MWFRDEGKSHPRNRKLPPPITTSADATLNLECRRKSHPGDRKPPLARLAAHHRIARRIAIAASAMKGTNCTNQMTIKQFDVKTELPVLTHNDKNPFVIFHSKLTSARNLFYFRTMCKIRDPVAKS